LSGRPVPFHRETISASIPKMLNPLCADNAYLKMLTIASGEQQSKLLVLSAGIDSAGRKL